MLHLLGNEAGPLARACLLLLLPLARPAAGIQVAARRCLGNLPRLLLMLLALPGDPTHTVQNRPSCAACCLSGLCPGNDEMNVWTCQDQSCMYTQEVVVLQSTQKPQFLAAAIWLEASHQAKLLAMNCISLSRTSQCPSSRFCSTAGARFQERCMRTIWAALSSTSSCVHHTNKSTHWAVPPADLPSGGASSVPNLAAKGQSIAQSGAVLSFTTAGGGVADWVCLA